MGLGLPLAQAKPLLWKCPYNPFNALDTKMRLTGETPFSLAYGIEAIIPPYITVTSMSIEMGSLVQNCK
ncbi:unnamed protein product [Prunus armeniaca]